MAAARTTRIFFNGGLRIPPRHRRNINGNFTAYRILGAIRPSLVGKRHSTRVLPTSSLMRRLVSTHFPVPGFEVSQLLQLFICQALRILARVGA